MLVLDSHIDTPSQIFRGRNIALDNSFGHVDFPKLSRGGVDGSFFALYTPPGVAPDAATRYALELLACVQDTVEENAWQCAFAFSPEEILRNKREGRFSVLLGMENGAPVQESLPLLRLFYRLGIRYLTLTHNEDNALADSAAQGKRWGGLSPFGRSAVAEMNRLGMMIDLSHSSDDTFWQVLEASRAPVIASHSSCRALCSHRRNLTDEMLRALGEKGGYVGVNLYPSFLSDDFGKSPEEEALLDEADALESGFIRDTGNEAKRRAWEEAASGLLKMKRPGVKEVVDHIDHAVSLAGVDHVGIGTDFDGILVPPSGLEDVSRMGSIFAEMRRRGYSEGQIERVAGKNLLEAFCRIISYSESAD